MFASGQVSADGRVYPFRLLLAPDATPGPHPLVVFLHGAGERGTDNERQLHWLPKTMAEPGHRQRHPCHLLAVQCPQHERWVEVPWDATQSTPLAAEPTPAIRAVLQAMDQVIAEHEVDASRVYLTGLSMGGYGCFDLAARHPERFAAVLAVCGGGDERQAERLAALPFWIWHGDADTAVPVARSRSMHAALRRSGAAVRYSELVGVGHDSWRQAYGDDGGLDWLFSQRRMPRPIADLVPWPTSLIPTDGTFRPTAPLQVEADASLQNVATALASRLGRRTGESIEVTEGGAQIRLHLDPGMAEDEARLDVDDTAATLRGGSAGAIARASSMLLQATRPDGASWIWPGVSVHDRPRYPFRAVMIDCARHHQSIPELRRVIELCSYYRVPYLQLHLSDHEAFRFGSMTLPDAVATEHYSMDELQRLDEFAQSLGVTLIPEIDLPGHSAALVAAYPELFAIADAQDRGIVNMGRAAARDAIHRLLTEVAATFRHTPYLHVGGDEVDLTGIAEDADCRACMQSEGLANPDALLRWFLCRLDEVVRGLGRKTMVWEGFTARGEPRVPEGVTVVAWDSSRCPPDQLAAAGHPIVNASWQPLYIVGGGKLPPHAAPRRWSAREIHSWHPGLWQHFDPSSRAFHPIELDEDAPVRGAMLCVWEQLDGTASHHLRGRLAAFAERCHASPERRDHRDFAARQEEADRLLLRLVELADDAPHDEWSDFLAQQPHRVRYRWYDIEADSLDALGDLDMHHPFATGTQPRLRGTGFSGAVVVTLDAELQVETSGSYRLRLESCDGPARLWIDDVAVLSQPERWQWQGAEREVELEAGRRSLRVEYAQGRFHTLCRLFWRPPGQHEFTSVETALAPIPDRR